jgi:hypothetical protein
MDDTEAIAGQREQFLAQRRTGKSRQQHIPNMWE